MVYILMSCAPNDENGWNISNSIIVCNISNGLKVANISNVIKFSDTLNCINGINVIIVSKILICINISKGGYILIIRNSKLKILQMV